MYDRSSLFQTVDINSPPGITLIIAESGYGKTVVAKQYVESLNIPYVWNTLDQWSAYEHAFKEETRTLLTRKYPSIQSTKNINGQDTGNPLQLAQHLRTYGAPVTYVIDNCQYINSSSTALAWLEEFIRETQGFCNFVMVGQEQPRLNLIDAIATMDILVLGKNQLRLTSNDAPRLAQKYGLNVDFVQKLITTNNGWFAGIRPWLQDVGKDLQDSSSPIHASQFTFDAYIDTTLTNINHDMLHFLNISCIPEQFTHTQLQDIFPDFNISVLIQDVYRHQLFLSDILDSGFYQYHELTRRIILNKLIQSDENLYRELNQKYADWYEEQELFDTAMYHYLEAQNPTDAIRLINYVLDTYRNQGLTDLILALGELFRQYDICVPALQLACSRILMSQLKFSQAKESIDDVYKLSATDISPILDTQLQTQRAYIAIRQGQFAYGISTLDTVKLNIVGTDDDSRSTLALIEHISGQALLELSNYEQAEDSLKKARELYLELNDQIEVANTLQDLALTYSKSGQLDKAGEPLLQMLSIRQQLNNFRELAHASNNIGSYYIQCHDYENGESYFVQGLEYAEKANDERIKSYLLWNLGDLYRDTNNSESALSHYDEALKMVSHADLYVQCGVLASLARFFSFQDRHQNAINIYDTLKATSQSLNSNLYLQIAELGKLLLDSTTPMDYLMDHFEAIQATRNQVELMRAIGPMLEFALLQEHHSAIAKLSDILLEQVKLQQSTQPFIAYLTHSVVLTQYIRDKLFFVELIELASQLKVRQKQSARQQLEIVNHTTHKHLQLTTFKAESIELDGKRLNYSELPSQIDRELIYWLYFTGPKRREEIKLHFWQDASPENAASAFSSLQYRIRNKFGSIIMMRDGIYQLDPEYRVTSDAFKFESFVEQARMGRNNDIRTEDLWLKALELYRGEFLIEFDRDWIIFEREKYHQYYIQTLVGLSRCAISREDDSAIAYAKWAIREDTFNESIYRHLMKILDKYGRIADIIDTYKSLNDLLLKELGVQVSRETKSLYLALTQNR